MNLLKIQITKKTLLNLILCILGISFSSFYNQTETEIEWNENRKLTFEDFKGKVPTGKDNISAETASGISISKVQWNGNYGKIIIKSIFDTKESWIRKNTSEFVLKHEQGHFDITEIYARKIRKKLYYKKFKRSNFTKYFNNIYNKNETEKNAYQLLYDRETNLSRNYQKQKEWDKKIEKELKSLEKFKDTEVIIILK
ncbi:MAG: hypothetical protein Kow0079_16880 [Vicingaceae bacterium]